MIVDSDNFEAQAHRQSSVPYSDVESGGRWQVTAMPATLR